MDYILTYSLYVLILSILMGVSTWKLFQKKGYSPITAFIPFYNYFIILKTTKNPKWWAVLAYLPIVGTIMMSVFHLFLMKKFDRSNFIQKLLTVFLPFIYMATVNYSSATQMVQDYEGQEEDKKESFIGSITFAAVFATLIHTFSFQPFGIPTGSMEKTLLVGDFLFVNKLNYGYRMPMRPLALPFLQGTIFDTGEKANPKDDPKSYVEAVKLPYLRLPGWEKVKKNDIVVFNYPDDSVHVSIDRKDPYVKRCVAVAGDVLEMKAGKLFINGKPEQRMGDAEVQQAYEVTTNSQLDIKNLYKAYGFLSVTEEQTADGFQYEFSGLTDGLANEIKKLHDVVSVKPKIDSLGQHEISYYPNIPQSIENQRLVLSNKINYSSTIFPHNKPWNIDWYGPLKIPKKGDVITLTADNLPTYQKLIKEYEHNDFEVKGGKFFINGKETNTYTVQQDYYFMMGDNRDASLDARFFGFVPETHIVGKPMFTWMSVEGLFSDSNSSYQADGKRIRWDRMFKATNTGEANKTSYWWVAAIVLTLFFGWDFFAKFFKKKKS